MFKACVEAVLRVIIRYYTTVTVTGQEHIPNGPCIVSANHNSHSDSIFLMLATNSRLSDMGYVAAYDYWFETKWRHFICSLFFNLIPVDRRPKETRKVPFKQTIQACADFTENTRKGRVIFYASGSRNKGTKTVKPGCVLLAASLALPILPVRLKNTDVFFGKKRKWFSPASIHIDIQPLMTLTFSRTEATGAFDSDDVAAAVKALEVSLYG